MKQIEVVAAIIRKDDKISLQTEAMHLNEHEAERWLSKDNLNSVKWLPADLLVLEVLNSNKIAF